MRKLMEQPDVKAKMEESRKEQQQLREREYAMVFKAMDRRQVAAFKRMLGKPFDVDSLMGGFRGPGQRNGQGGGTTKNDTTKAANTKQSASNAAATSKSTTPRKQSLRERRGLRQQPPPGDSPNN
jgi:hypothetical protein